MSPPPVIIRALGCQAYLPVYQAMQQFTGLRDENNLDELWWGEHQPVFTQGQNGSSDHIIDLHNVPLVQTDRGGQITYHGPGQLMIYPLFNLARRAIGVRDFVSLLENSVITLLARLDIPAKADTNARGVYVDGAKICSIGLRVKRGSSYHGLALNVGMDLTPFSYINPCGYKDLKMTMIQNFKPEKTLAEIANELIELLCESTIA